ncbi:myoD family inhibitor isoform X1 [Erpetoichthys calabaricus]|uniref:MyoD family inhibitor n=1 Tax=Erpetoichthys calabaricus TaxID=27687 RepID=A0A8C4RSF6_ERPCA|nr:myoD family inhibitor isoform X1 [Erpetoichthys calabaricus]
MSEERRDLESVPGEEDVLMVQTPETSHFSEDDCGSRLLAEVEAGEDAGLGTCMSAEKNSRTGLAALSENVTCQPQAQPALPLSALERLPEHGSQWQSVVTQGPQQNGVENGTVHGGPRVFPQVVTQKPHKKLQSNPSINSHSSKKSKGSSKSTNSQIPAEVEGDCCVHCILACLFCEFLSLCNIMLDCATCGSCTSSDSCFCCCCASEECGDCDMPCDMDCGIIDACCESADCLEICMECCGLCFSS